MPACFKLDIKKKLKKEMRQILLLPLLLLFISCSIQNQEQNYSVSVYQTSKSGDNLKLLSSAQNNTSVSEKNKLTLRVSPNQVFQKYYGFGASFTESSAWNLATIPASLRKKVLTKLFSPTEGAGFSLTRTHINSSDYSNNHYTYIDKNDKELKTFSIYQDMKGFSGDENSQVKGIKLEDPSYDLIPMIKEASAIAGADFDIISSAWSPPSWMKSGETSEMTNGTLRPEYYAVWAQYLSKYVSAYAKQGIKLWGITPQNEPLHSHDARWDSNGFTSEQGRDFLKLHLGPQLVKDGHLNLDDLDDGLRVLIYDHNKSTMNDYVKVTYQDPEAAKYAWGTGFHWYANSELKENNWHTDALDEHQTNWPTKGMIHTESSMDIDEKDPIGQYWRDSTDYAGVYVPFETYAYDIISDLNHGTQGYIEWCMILSNKGQPNPYDNFNSAPVLINPLTDEVIYTPLYYLLSHFSKFIKPEAHRIGLDSSSSKDLIYTAAQNKDGSIVVVIYNNNNESYEISVELDNTTKSTQIAAKAMQTIYFTK